MNFYRQLVVVNASITRPANTTTYAAGDVIGSATTGVMTLTSAARVATAAGFISSIVLVDDTNAALNLDADIFFYDTAPAAQADNVAFNPSYAEQLRCLGVASIIGTDGKEGTSNVTYNGIMPSPGKIDFVSVTANLFAVMVARNAYIPASGEIFALRVYINQA